MTLGGGYLLPSREGKQIAAIGLGITMKANGKSTRDAYSLFEYAIPAADRAVRHRTFTRARTSRSSAWPASSTSSSAARTSPRHGRLPVPAARRRPHLPQHLRRGGTGHLGRLARPGLRRYYQALAELPPGPKDIAKMKAIMADFGLVLQLPPEVR